MSKITNDGLTRSGNGIGCFTAVPILQQWVSIIPGKRTQRSHILKQADQKRTPRIRRPELCRS